jgi:hypothetical protein
VINLTFWGSTYTMKNAQGKKRKNIVSVPDSSVSTLRIIFLNSDRIEEKCGRRRSQASKN